MVDVFLIQILQSKNKFNYKAITLKALLVIFKYYYLFYYNILSTYKYEFFLIGRNLKRKITPTPWLEDNQCEQFDSLLSPLLFLICSFIFKHGHVYVQFLFHYFVLMLKQIFSHVTL